MQRKLLEPIKVMPWTKKLKPLPSGLSLFDHQTKALIFALERNRSYLGLDAGLGKTPVAALVAVNLEAVAVYVSPPFLVQNIEAEFSRWAPKLSVEIFGQTFNGISDPDVLIVPDSLLVRDNIVSQIKIFLSWSSKEKLLIVDECHRQKNPEAKRTKGVFGHLLRSGAYREGLADIIDRQIYMSGTPIPNRPIELFPVLSKAAPETIGHRSFFEYGLHYCAAFSNRFGWDFSGSSNMGELREKVQHPTGPFMLRMRKHLLNLPPKIEEIFVISKGLSSRLSLLEENLFSRYTRIEDLIKSKVAEAAGVGEEELSIATYRRMLGQEKIEPAAEFIKNVIEDTEESVLVFAYHKDVISGLTAALKTFHDPLVISGETPIKKRQEIVSQFQNSKSKRILIGNYVAMGVGFTLTKATRIIFVEFDWVPGVNSQAADRAHRIGQKESVLVQYMVYKNSIDQAVLETLIKKQKAISQI